MSTNDLSQYLPAHFRSHRGSLSDSMDTLCVVNTLDDLKAIAVEEFCLAPKSKESLVLVLEDYYATDDRPESGPFYMKTTYLVVVQGEGALGFLVTLPKENE